MEKGIIETVDNFLDSLGTTGRVAVELADPTGVTGLKDLSNATEALKEKKSIGNIGNFALALAGELPVIGGGHNAQTDYISQLQFQQGITANIGETTKDAFKSGAPYGADFILPASAIRVSRYKQGNKLKLIKKNNANKRRIRISSSIR